MRATGSRVPLHPVRKQIFLNSAPTPDTVGFPIVIYPELCEEECVLQIAGLKTAIWEN